MNKIAFVFFSDCDSQVLNLKEITDVDTTIKDELYVLTDSIVYIPENITKGCHFRIHPPW